MTSFRYLIPHYEVYTVPSGMVPGLLEYMDYPDVGSLSMPTPLLVVHGQQDNLFPADGVKAAIENLRRCYHAIGRPERFDTFPRRPSQVSPPGSAQNDGLVRSPGLM
jgi:hypothetical protein